MYVSREDDLRVLTGPGDDGLDFVGCEILGLVDDEANVRQAPSAYVRQGRDDQLFKIHHFRDPLILLIGFVVLVLDEFQIVPERLHVGIKLRLDITRQVPDVLVAERHDGAGEINLFVVALLFQARRQGDKGLTRSGHALYGN